MAELLLASDYSLSLSLISRLPRQEDPDSLGKSGGVQFSPYYFLHYHSDDAAEKGDESQRSRRRRASFSDRGGARRSRPAIRGQRQRRRLRRGGSLSPRRIAKSRKAEAHRLRGKPFFLRQAGDVRKMPDSFQFTPLLIADFERIFRQESNVRVDRVINVVLLVNAPIPRWDDRRHSKGIRKINLNSDG